eukprot:CAMPEP_0196815742 /NCGR_PEP_ID=MMETSP1362-20130617/51643_1 /TAXON_ID=163516 /ORGANISM="Leptocylindrus danicus, Strain CCMP1856" /LENGTH=41 /DNA_ID= /DNA_START= /DNA_END= /DNA_ORIENTATION=
MSLDQMQQRQQQGSTIAGEAAVTAAQTHCKHKHKHQHQHHQ